MTDFWRFFSPDLRELLGEEDDPAFWQVAVDRILADTHVRATAYAGKEAILVQVGRCSHWIRPHTKNRAGTAWPFGYGNTGQGFSLTSLPEFDWSLRWVLRRESGAWIKAKGQPSRRPLVQRIAIPARTAKHPKGTVHTIWLPGSPEDPRRKLTSVYGFEEAGTGWECVDHWQKEHSSVSKR
ncbi:MAG TPA: hypothetical protein VG013_00675 [Gemmataceae bacterium]|nr:hypothetical protein [Gemmataceae bacterium]